MNKHVGLLVTLTLMTILVCRFMILPFVRKLYRLMTVKNKVETFGEITAFKTRKNWENHTQYLSIVRFADIHGREVTTESEEGTFIQPAVGKKVRITYERDNPQNALVNRKKSIAFYLFLVFFVVSVLTFLWIGVLTSN